MIMARWLMVYALVSAAGCSGGKDTGSCGDDGSGNVLSVDGEWYNWRFNEPSPAPTSCEPAPSQFSVRCEGTITLEVAYVASAYDSDGVSDEKAGSVVVRLGSELVAGNNDTLGSSASGVSINHEGATGLGPSSTEAYSNAVSLSSYEPGAAADGAFLATWIDPATKDIIAEASGSFTVDCP